MQITLLKTLLLCALTFTTASYAADEKTNKPADTLELTTTYIKGNKELPQTLYIVPWQEVKSKKTKQENMVLHSLYGDIFEPSLVIGKKPAP